MGAHIFFDSTFRKFTKAKFRKEIIKNAKNIRKKATEEFIKTAVKIIPIDSGAAAATFIPLARLNSTKGIGADIRSRILRRRVDDTHGVSAGVAHGVGTFKTTTDEITADFGHNLDHFTINENNAMGYKNGQRPTPWDVLEEAGEAASLVIVEEIEKRNLFPKIKDFSTIRQISAR